MSTVAEIEAAIRKLTPEEFDALVQRIDTLREPEPPKLSMEEWLKRAAGGATDKSLTTDQIMKLTRGDD
jgi:hypothetical protein